MEEQFERVLVDSSLQFGLHLGERVLVDSSHPPVLHLFGKVLVDSSLQLGLCAPIRVLVDSSLLLAQELDLCHVHQRLQRRMWLITLLDLAL